VAPPGPGWSSKSLSGSFACRAAQASASWSSSQRGGGGAQAVPAGVSGLGVGVSRLGPVDSSDRTAEEWLRILRLCYLLPDCILARQAFARELLPRLDDSRIGYSLIGYLTVSPYQDSNVMPGGAHRKAKIAGILTWCMAALAQIGGGCRDSDLVGGGMYRRRRSLTERRRLQGF
jgi:hypothetical protein